MPIVQAGTTEEKSEIVARIQWSGTGLRLGTTRPTPRQVGRAVDRVLREPSFARAAPGIAAEMAPMDAGRLGADALEELARTYRRDGVPRPGTPSVRRAGEGAK